MDADTETILAGIGEGERFIFAMARPLPNQAPAFDDGDDTTRAIAEDAADGADVGAPVVATDPDATDTLEYSISGDSNFSIVSSSGQIQVATGASLDHETDDSHIVTVTVTDSVLSDTITVTVDVTNVDEAGTVSLPAARPLAGTAYTATLSDSDGSLSSVSWQWARSASASGSFTNIAAATSASYTPADSAAGMYLRATASYTDGHGSGKTAQAVSSNTVEARNIPPAFSSNATTRSVAENQDAGTNVGAPVVAADPGDTVTYSITGTNPAGFTVLRASGQIQTGRRLDHEADDSYAITLLAEDSASQQDTITVTINVTNVDEAGAVSLPAVQPLAGTAYTATLTDPDGSLSSVSWQWARSASASGSFTNIATATSASYSPADGDVGMYLRATASYTDGHGSGKTAQAVTSNTVAARNIPPAFSSNATTRSVAENQDAGTNVGAPVVAADPGDTVTYSITGANPAGFTVLRASGQIQTGRRLDHEADDSYAITLLAEDSASQQDTIAVTISVTDENDAPTFPGTATTREVNENVTGGTQLGQAVAATDQDGDNLVYTLSGTTAFEIGRTTGVLTVAQGASLDHETQERHRFTVTAQDPSNAQDTIQVTVTVRDVNDSPVFAVDEVDRVITEGATGGTNLGAPLTAQDQDGDQLVYSLSGSSDFRIVSGQIKVADGRTLDYETTPSYTLVVTADDRRGGTDTVQVNVSVTDGNDPPVFASNAVTRTIPENSPEGTTVGAPVVASDPNPGDSVSYTLRGAPEFEVVRTTGQIQVAAGAVLDFETTRRYTVLVTATDSFGLRSLATVTISLTDIFENPSPDFGEDAVVREVHENAPAGTRVGAPVAASDPGDRLEYTLSGPDAARFEVDLTTGQITVGASTVLDYETKKSYSVTVTATDPHGGTDAVEVTITVVDLDEVGYLGAVEFAIGCNGTACGFVQGSYGSLTDGDYPDDLFDGGSARTVREIREDAAGFWYLRYDGGSGDAWLSDVEDLDSILVRVEYEGGIDTREFVLGGFIEERLPNNRLKLAPPIPGRDWQGRNGQDVVMTFRRHVGQTPQGHNQPLSEPDGRPGSFVAYLSESTPGGPVMAQTMMVILVYIMFILRTPATPWGIIMAAVVLVLTPWIPVLFGYGEEIAAAIIFVNVLAGAFAYKVLFARTES